MRPQATGIRKASTFAGQKIAMSIDTSAMAHIMSVLTNLYSDPELAVLREYSCNARDSHLAAGNTAPIQVTLPTRFSHFLVIEDFGLGLSIDDITEIYSRYGASTKRDTDEQTGMLGLGSKSALTYATQFTMTSVKDGVKAEVLISVDTLGAGAMEVMDTCATDQANGVRITIPTRPDNSFADHAADLFAVWPEGSVLVDGKAPEHLKGRYIDANKRFFITDENDRYYAKHILVMGGVPYPITSGHSRDIRNLTTASVYIYADMGEVDFVPSREAMNYTPRTNAALERLVKEFAAELYAEAIASFAAADGPAEAYELARRYRTNTYIENVVGAFTYKGTVIPAYFDSPTSFYVWSESHWGKRKTHKSSRVQMVEADAIFISGYTVDGPPSAHIRAKVNKWATDNGHAEPGTMYFIDKDFIGQWMTAPIVDYSTVKAVKVPKAAVQRASGGKIRMEDWDTLNSHGNLVEQNGDKIKNDVIFYSPVDIQDRNYNVHRGEVRTALVNTFPNHTLIEAGKNRHDRIQREFPTAITLEKAVKDHIEALTKAMPARTYALGTLPYRHSNDWERIAKDGTINDSVLAQELRDLRQASKDVDELRQTAARWNTRLDYYISLNESFDKYVPAITKYPLLAVSRVDTHPADVVQYINMKHSTATEGK